MACCEIRSRGQTLLYICPRVDISRQMDTIQSTVMFAKIEFHWGVARLQLIGQRWGALLTGGGSDLVTFPFDLAGARGYYITLLTDYNAMQKRLREAYTPTAAHFLSWPNERVALKLFCCSDNVPVARQVAKRSVEQRMNSNLVTVD